MDIRSPLSVQECAQFLCREATQTEGVTLSTRVLVEALTPGLRHFNAFFKESLRMARTTRAPEVEASLGESSEFIQLLGIVCRDLSEAQDQEWWRRVVEVAECGAQREVITRLIYKQIAGSEEAQEFRVRWRATYLEQGGAKPIIRELSKHRSDAEGVIIEQLAQAALQLRPIPKQSSEEQVEWLISQRKLTEAVMSQNWTEARVRLRDLVKISPRDPMVSLYWSLIKCSEGKIEEALNGVKRAAEVAPQDQSMVALAQESELWLASLVDERRAAERSIEDHRADSLLQDSLLQDSLLQETRLGQPTQSHAARSRSPQETDALLDQQWRLPTGLLQAIADLGPDRTLDLSISGLMSQLYHLTIKQNIQLKNALAIYPEASGLRAMELQIKRSQALIQRGLGVYKVDPRGETPIQTIGGSTGVATLTPHQLAELRGMEFSEKLSVLDTPPPIPQLGQGGEVAPTAMVNLVNPENGEITTGSPESLSIDNAISLDFTIEPEATDLARAEQLMRRGEFAQAEHCLLSLLDQNPFDACVHNDLGVLYFQTQRFGDAKAHFMLAVECNPNYEEAWSNLVELFASLGHLHHALPFFRRFEALIDHSASLRRLHKLCAQFAPDNVESLESPQYADTVGLKLPLSGSFFLAPAVDESISEALSTPIPPEWDPEEQKRLNEEKQRAQRDLAVQKRAEINALLEGYTRSSASKPKKPSGLINWLKTQIGINAMTSETDDALEAGEIDLETAFDPLAPRAPAPKHLPEDIHRVRNIAFSMLCVPAGSFKMGTNINSSYGCANEMPQHIAVMSRPFQMAQVPVTQELYQAVMFRNPSHIKAPGHPVVRVSWFDAIRFCNTLSDLEGLPPAYIIASGARPEVAIVQEAAGYRLPYEAEWEYCARARQAYKYAGSDEIHRVGWAQTDKMQTAARKDPNSWGFYDFSGNVWEWCNDSLREYNSDSQIDPQGEAHPYMHTPSARGIRGGSWCFEEDGARVAFRGRGALGLRISSLGFRIARSL